MLTCFLSLSFLTNSVAGNPPVDKSVNCTSSGVNPEVTSASKSAMIVSATINEKKYYITLDNENNVVFGQDGEKEYCFESIDILKTKIDKFTFEAVSFSTFLFNQGTSSEIIKLNMVNHSI